VVLYESAPATDAEFGAEAARMVAELAERRASDPRLADTLNAFAQIPTIADDESMMRVARGHPGVCGLVLDRPGSVGRPPERPPRHLYLRLG
jgi:hypothetical protein